MRKAEIGRSLAPSAKSATAKILSWTKDGAEGSGCIPGGSLSALNQSPSPNLTII